jgi:hypothetical protein
MTFDHPKIIFDLLDRLGNLDPEELVGHFTEENVNTLKMSAPLLKEGMELERYLSEKRFVEIVNELCDLKKIWSVKLDETLSNAGEAYDRDEKVQAMWILEGFIRFCPSPYYSDIAERVLEGYGED